MKRLVAVIAASLVAMFVVSGAGAQKAVYGVDLSPDGSTYAVLKPYGEQSVVAFYSVDNPEAQPVAVGLGDIETGAFAWGGNNHVLLQAFGEKGGIDLTTGLATLRISRWMSIAKDTGETETLFTRNEIGDYYYINRSAGTLISSWPSQPDRALFLRGSIKTKTAAVSRLSDGDDTFVLSLLSANLRNGRIRKIESGNEKTIDWVVDRDGKAIARIDTLASDRKLAIFVRPSGKSSFNRTADIDLDALALKDIDFVGLSEDETRLQAFAVDNAGANRLVAFDINNGAFGGAILEPGSGQISAIEYDFQRNRATAVYTTGETLGVHHLSEVDRLTQESLAKVLPGATPAIVSRSSDGGRMIVKAFYADRPTEYYFYDKPGRRLELIAQE